MQRTAGRREGIKGRVDADWQTPATYARSGKNPQMSVDGCGCIPIIDPARPTRMAASRYGNRFAQHVPVRTQTGRRAWRRQGTETAAWPEQIRGRLGSRCGGQDRGCRSRIHGRPLGMSLKHPWWDVADLLWLRGDRGRSAQGPYTLAVFACLANPSPTRMRCKWVI